MTPEELKFDIGMLEDRKRRASFPKMVALGAYIAAAIIVCLLITVSFPGDSAPEWLLLLLAPAAMGGWFGIWKFVDHWSPLLDWTQKDQEKLDDLKRQLATREDPQ